MMKPFNLERSLAGEPVILRNGSKAYVQYTGVELIYGVDLGRKRWTAWEVNGSLYENRRDDDCDIVGMWPKEPLAMPDIFWDMVHPHYNSIAKEASGTWYAYSVKPEKDRTIWVSDEGDFINLSTHLSCSIFPDCDWEDSLILRPSK